MDLLSAIAAFLIGTLSGFLSVLAGGGVTVVLPVLLALGLTADQVNATSRMNLTVGALIATIALLKRKSVDWQTTRPLLIVAIAGSTLGALFGTHVNSALMLAVMVGTASFSMILVYLRPNRWLTTVKQAAVVPPNLGLVIYFALCFYGGVIAVDSAILRLCALVLLLGFPLAKANPIKVVTGLALFGISSFIYGEVGDIYWPVAIWLSLGTALGAFFATRFVASPQAQNWIYRVLQVVVTVETCLLFARWLGLIS